MSKNGSAISGDVKKRARDRRLDSRDIEALNRRLAMELPITGAMDTVIVIQETRLVILSIAYKLRCLHVLIFGKLSFFQESIIE